MHIYVFMYFIVNCKESVSTPETLLFVLGFRGFCEIQQDLGTMSCEWMSAASLDLLLLVRDSAGFK